VLRFAVTCIAACLIAGCAAGAEVAEAPEPALALTGRVVDAADILSDAFERDLTADLAQLEEDTLVQLVVATTPGLEGRTIEGYALELGNAWGLGDAQRNDGLLILVAPNERLVRIEVGLGLEEAIRDEEAKIIIDSSIIPHFRKGGFEAGIAAGVEALAREVSHLPMEQAA